MSCAFCKVSSVSSYGGCPVYLAVYVCFCLPDEKHFEISFLGLRCLGRGVARCSCLLFTVLTDDGEDGAGLSLLSSLLAVSELREPELTPLNLHRGIYTGLSV